GVWTKRRGNCSRRIRTESAESAAGYARAHRHAARVCNFSDRPPDLAKNSSRKRLETARSGSRVCTAYGRNVDQRSHSLCVSPTGNSIVPIARFQVGTARAALYNKYDGWEAVTP